MISSDTVPFRTIVALARQRRGIDAGRCRAVFELLSAANSLRGAFRREFDRMQLTETDFAVLVTLYAIAPDHSTLANMAAQTGSSRPSMTESADRLEARGLVRRKRATDDRRAIFIELTEPGSAIAEQGLTRLIEKAHCLGATITADTDALLIETCRRLDNTARAERAAG